MLGLCLMLTNSERVSIYEWFGKRGPGFSLDRDRIDSYKFPNEDNSTIWIPSMLLVAGGLL